MNQKNQNSITKIFSNENITLTITVFLIGITLCAGILYAHPPLKLNSEHETALEVSDWLKTEGYSERPILSSFGFLLVVTDNPHFKNTKCKFDCMYTSFSQYKNAEKGTIIVWDPHYSWQFAQPNYFESKDYNLLKEFNVKGTETKFLIFEKMV